MKYLRVIFSALFIGMVWFSSGQSLNDAGTVFNEAIQFQKEQQNDQAIEAYKKCISIASQLGPEGDDLKMKSQTQLSNIFLSKGIDAYKSKDPDNAIVFLSESYNYAETTGDLEGMQKASKMLGSVYSYKGKVAIKEKDFNASIDFLNKAIGYNPDTDYYYYLVYAYSKNDDEPNMKAAIDKLIEIGGNDNEDVIKAKSVVSKFYLANAVDAAKKQDYKKVIEIINTGFAYDDKDPMAYYYLAVAHNSLSQFDEAIQAAEAGIGLEKEDASNFYFEAGKAYEGLGKNDKACENYKKVTQGPNLEAAKYQITTALKCQ